jgi:hypothetical protein
MYFVFSVPVPASASVACCTSHLCVVSASAVIFLLPIHGRYTISSSVVVGVTKVCHAISTDGATQLGLLVAQLDCNTCHEVQYASAVSTPVLLE